MHHDTAGRRGSAMILTTIIVIIVAGLGAAFLTISFRQNLTTYNASVSEGALTGAEAGLDDAIQKLNAFVKYTWQGNDDDTNATFTAPAFTPPMHPSSYTSSSGSSTTYIPTAPTLCSAVSDSLDFSAINRIYTVIDPVTKTTTTANVVTGSVGGSAFTAYIIPHYSGRGQYRVTSRATRGNESRGINIVITAGDPYDIGDFGMFGKVTLSTTSANVFIDSYKSSLGSYASQATNTYSDGKTTYTYARDKGNVGTNGNISHKNGIIFGNATPGPGKTVTGSGIVTGSTLPAPEVVDLPTPAYKVPAGIPLSKAPAAPLVLGASGTSTVYHFEDLVTKGSFKSITIKGNVTLYVDDRICMNAGEILEFSGPDAQLTLYHGSGNITLNGQSLTGGATANPNKFQIFSSSTGDITFNGGSTAYVSVSAPSMWFKQTGTNVFYGRIIASTIDVGGNMTFHRDEDMASGPKSAPTYVIKAWQEYVP